MKRVLANSIDQSEIARVAHDVVAGRWDNFDLTEFLVYLVDTTVASTLPYLAEQFMVDGLRGFTVAETEQEQRELIKQAIRLHKLIGTPYSIKRACATVGFPIIILVEGVDTGDPNTDWARFDVWVTTEDNRTVTGELMDRIRALINLYKPERSHLGVLGFFLLLEEQNRVFAPIEGMSDDENLYDGEFEYNGEITYGARRRLELDIYIDGNVLWSYILSDRHFAFPLDINNSAIAVSIDV